MKITSKAGTNHLRIYVDGHLHVFLRRAQVAGLQSWRERGRKLPYKIEVATKMGDPILFEYDDEAKWHAVLGEIDKCVAGWR